MMHAQEGAAVSSLPGEGVPAKWRGMRLSPTERQIAARPYIRLWLYGVATLLMLMVLIGGATRLTDSGLSITEWQPLLGVIPPLSQDAWQEAFAKYRGIPEYQVVHAGMTLEQFKFIYWWEWVHRFLGRFIGVAFFLPLVGFAASRSIERGLGWRLLSLFLLGGAQGALGWYMVKSGLVDRVDVSQYRLAAHLSLAIAILAAALWIAWGIGRPGRLLSWRRPASLVAAALVALVFVQIAAGGFVAGLDAGQGYNTWPLMDGAVIPAGLDAMSPGWRNLFENALTVQFVHRGIAYLLFATALMNFVVLYRAGAEQWRAAALLMLAVLGQMALGIWTLLEHVPVPLGLAHQAGALVVLVAALWNLNRAASSRELAVGNREVYRSLPVA
jgi:cytochrome c oxidase assembly protein subunit 15